jgi:ribokinase
MGSFVADLAFRAPRLPEWGQTILGSEFRLGPGGKGSNQAVAAARLGAEVAFVTKLGRDAFGDLARRTYREEGIDTEFCFETVEHGTGGAAIVVHGERGENAIVVAPGANLELKPDDLDLGECDAVLCQLEIPLETVERASQVAPDGFFLNAAPARAPYPAADVTIVNKYEVETLPQRDGVVVTTLGAEGAILYENGVEVARAVAPHVEAVDGTGAGDAFTACFVVSVLEGRSNEEALRRACVAGALAASRLGAQTSMPTADEVDALL